MSSRCKASNKDKRIFIKCQGENVVFCGTTVNDCFFICNRNQEWLENQVEKLKKKFKEITMETGNELGLIECKLK